MKFTTNREKTVRLFLAGEKLMAEDESGLTWSILTVQKNGTMYRHGGMPKNAGWVLNRRGEVVYTRKISR